MEIGLNFSFGSNCCSGCCVGIWDGVVVVVDCVVCSGVGVVDLLICVAGAGGWVGVGVVDCWVCCWISVEVVGGCEFVVVDVVDVICVLVCFDWTDSRLHD